MDYREIGAEMGFWVAKAEGHVEICMGSHSGILRKLRTKVALSHTQTLIQTLKRKKKQGMATKCLRVATKNPKFTEMPRLLGDHSPLGLSFGP